MVVHDQIQRGRHPTVNCQSTSTLEQRLEVSASALVSGLRAHLGCIAGTWLSLQTLSPRSLRKFSVSSLQRNLERNHGYILFTVHWGRPLGIQYVSISSLSTFPNQTRSAVHSFKGRGGHRTEISYVQIIQINDIVYLHCAISQGTHYPTRKRICKQLPQCA
jgi:hypothetical protein